MKVFFFGNNNDSSTSFYLFHEIHKRHISIRCRLAADGKSVEVEVPDFSPEDAGTVEAESVTSHPLPHQVDIDPTIIRIDPVSHVVGPLSSLPQFGEPAQSCLEQPLSRGVKHKH